MDRNARIENAPTTPVSANYMFVTWQWHCGMMDDGQKYSLDRLQVRIVGGRACTHLACTAARMALSRAKGKENSTIAEAPRTAVSLPQNNPCFFFAAFCFHLGIAAKATQH